MLPSRVALPPDLGKHSILWLAGLAATVVYLKLSPGSLLMPDSPGYIYFDPGRPVGYPFFLAVIKFFTGGYEHVGPIQIVMLGVSSAVVASVVGHTTQRWIIALVLEIGLLAYPAPFKSANVIASDALSTCLYLLFIASLFWFGARPSLRRYLPLCLIVFLAITVRPVNIAMVPGALAAGLYFLGLKSAIRSSGPILAAAILGICITPATNYLLHGSPKSYTPLVRGLFAKAIFGTPPETSAMVDADLAFIRQSVLPLNDYIQKAPPEFRDLMRRSISDYLRFNVIIPTLVERHRFQRSVEVDPILLSYTREHIRRDPLYFLGQIAREYVNLARNYTFITRDEREQYQEFLENNPPPLPALVPDPTDYKKRLLPAAIAEMHSKSSYVPGEADEMKIEAPQARPMVLTLAIDAIQVLAVAISLGSLLLLPILSFKSRVGSVWAIIGIASVLIQMNMVATALVETALPRYMYPIWPLLWLVLVLAGWKLWSIAATPRMASGSTSDELFVFRSQVGHVVPELRHAAATTAMD
jgi:hypothetical protein